MAEEKPQAEETAPKFDMAKWLVSISRFDLPAPFVIDGTTGKLLGATDGHAMVLVADAKPPADAKEFKPAQDYFDRAQKCAWQRVLFSDLCAWAMRQNARCAICGGLGFYKLDGVVAFDSDGMGPIGNLWKKCPGCSNTRAGQICGVTINRALLLEFMAPLHAVEHVEIAASSDGALVVRADNWMVIVMRLDEPMGEQFVPSDKPPAPREPETAAQKAVTYLLNRIQTDPDMYWVAGRMTESFHLLCVAEAERTGETVQEVEHRREKDLQPEHRKRRAEVLELREEVQRLRG